MNTRLSAALVCLLSCSSLSVAHAQATSAPARAPSPAAASASAQTAPGAARVPFPHYTDKSRGWFWKEAFPDDEELPEPEVQKPPPPPAPPAAPAPPPGPKPLSSAWMKENLPKYLEAAIDDPTPQNVSNYLYLQKMTFDAADRFSQEFRRVAVSDPNLDYNTARPTWNAAGFSADDTAEKGKRDTLKSLAKTHGIWFFFRSDCQACHMMAPVLESFSRQYGFTIYPITIDGQNMPNSPFSTFVKDRGQAAMLDVQYTPAIFLAKPPGGIYPISQAPIALSDLETRVIEIASANGAINEDQYQATRADRKNLLPAPSRATALTEEAAANPNAVRDHLRALLKKPTSTR